MFINQILTKGLMPFIAHLSDWSETQTLKLTVQAMYAVTDTPLGRPPWTLPEKKIVKKVLIKRK